MNFHSRLLVPCLLIAPALIALAALSPSGAQPQPAPLRRDLVLTVWQGDRTFVCPGMVMEKTAEKSPAGEPLTRITLGHPDPGQDVLTAVNLPAAAGNLSIFMRSDGVCTGRHEALFCDAHGWGGAGNTLWAFKGDTTYTTSAAKPGWSWRVGFFHSTPEAPFMFRGLRLQGRDAKDSAGRPVSVLIGPAHVSYTPDDRQWLYVDFQPKLISSRDGVQPPQRVRVANLGTLKRTFHLTARLVERNRKPVDGSVVSLGEIALDPGQLVELPVKLPLGLLGRYRVEYRADGGSPELAQTAGDTISVVNALDLAEAFRHRAAARNWFSVETRRAQTVKDPATGQEKAQVTISTASDGISPVPIFPVERRIPQAMASWNAAVGKASDPLVVLDTQLSPAWLVRSQDRTLRFFGDTRRSGLGAPSHTAFATAGGVHVLGAGATLDAASLRQMSQPWLLAWWQGSDGWTQWDVPYLVVLQRRPTGLVLDDRGLSLTFAGPAGSVATMPLFGYAKLPQQAAFTANQDAFRVPARWPADALHPWTWTAALPPFVLDRCNWWARSLRKFPYAVHETYTVDHASGSLQVRDAFDYVNIADDWKTPALVAAPLSPTLALAMQAGFPMHVNGKLTDCECATLLGPYTVLEGAASLDYRMDIGPYWMQAADPNLAVPADRSTPAREAQGSLLDLARSSTGDNESQMWDYEDGNFVWYMQSSDMRDPAYLTGYTTGTARQDRKGWLQARVLHSLLNPARYQIAERGPTLTRRYIDGPGIGDWGSSDYGDAGKLGTDMIFDAYVYAYNTGDYQTIADYWDVITSLNTTPLTMSWATQGRSAIAELGDEAPPMLALARLAYAVGDRQTYAAAVNWYARELVHHVVKDGAFVRYREQFRPWHPGWDTPTETATNLWGTNASWQGGGFRSASGGENQWGNFYVRFDDPDVLRFHRKYAAWYPRRVAALATPAEKKTNYPIYFARAVLLGEDPAQARTDFVQGTDKSPDNYATRRAVAEREFPPKLETLIPSTAPAVQGNAWAQDQMGGNSFGLVSQSEMLKSQMPTPKWFWWASPATVPGVDGGDKWTFGTISPGDDRAVGAIASEEINPAATVFRFALRQGMPLDRLPEPIRSTVAKANLPAADLRAVVAAWNEQTNIPVMVCGPFTNPGGGPNTATVHSPEKSYLAGTLSLSETYRDDATAPDPKNSNAYHSKGAPIRWQKAIIGGTYLDFLRLWPDLRPVEDMAAYVAFQVKSPVDMAAQVACGSDDGIKVWINGKVVHDNAAKRGGGMDEDHAPAQLKAGWNSVLIEVTQSDGGWNLNFRFATPAGAPIPGLEFRDAASAPDPH